MRAIVQDRYGPPDVLELREVERPTVGDGEVLVRVRAASVNPQDWHLMRASPFIVRASGYRAAHPDGADQGNGRRRAGRGGRQGRDPAPTG